MRLNRSTSLRLALGLTLVGAAFAGCVLTTVPPPSQALQGIAVVQHTTTLALAPGQDASATATCAIGEVLVSGGYSTDDVLDYEKPPQVVSSYPSDSSGTAPTSSSQAEDSWTVQVVNATASTISYRVAVNCLTGRTVTAVGFATRVWQQPFGDDSYGGFRSTVTCPGGRVLTGGGYQGAVDEPSDSSVFPLSTAGSQAWIVNTGKKPSGNGFAVCATQATPGSYVDGFLKDNQAVKQVAPGHYQGAVSVTCPGGETLVGAGSYGSDGRLQPWSHDGMADGDTTHWQVAFDYVDVVGSDDQFILTTYISGAHTTGGSFDDGAEGICITISTTRNGKVTIPFSNYHWLLRIPADKVVVATDGSGQIRAGKLSARASQVRSKSIAASKTINQATGGVSYSVPSGCGSPTPAIDAATNAVMAQLKQETTPSGQVAFGGITVTTNRASLTCAPMAGTVRTTPFTYTQAIDATASRGAYDPKTIVSYQNAQLQQATKLKGSPYVLRDTLICPGGPKLVSTTNTRATLQCTAYGVAEWPWSADQLHTLAQSLAGKTVAEAQQILDSTPGIEAGSAVIGLPAAADGKLPDDAGDITLVLVRTQDTAPVVRAP